MLNCATAHIVIDQGMPLHGHKLRFCLACDSHRDHREKKVFIGLFSKISVYSVADRKLHLRLCSVYMDKNRCVVF